MKLAARPRDERGVTTAEYAVGTIGATALGLCLYKAAEPLAERLMDPPPGFWDWLHVQLLLTPDGLTSWLPWR